MGRNTQLFYFLAGGGQKYQTVFDFSGGGQKYQTGFFIFAGGGQKNQTVFYFCRRWAEKPNCLVSMRFSFCSPSPLPSPSGPYHGNPAALNLDGNILGNIVSSRFRCHPTLRQEFRIIELFEYSNLASCYLRTVN